MKSFGPSSCSTQFNTKFFTLFSRFLSLESFLRKNLSSRFFSRTFLWTLCPLLLSCYHIIILLIFISRLSHHHQNHHSVLDVTKSCQNKWENEISLIFLLVRKLGKSGEASKSVTITGAVTDQQLSKSQSKPGSPFPP